MWRIAGLGLLQLVLGCSTTSTISRLSGPNVEGEIVGGSPDSIFVRRDAGGEEEIPRRDVSAIDFPGNVHTGAGIGVLAYGILNIAVGLPECRDRRDQQAAYCTGVFLPAVIGAAIATWGVIVNQGQKSGVKDQSRASRAVAAPPLERLPNHTTTPQAGPRRPSEGGGAAPGPTPSTLPAEAPPTPLPDVPAAAPGGPVEVPSKAYPSDS